MLETHQVSDYWSQRIDGVSAGYRQGHSMSLIIVNS